MILNKTIKIGALFTALILMLTGCSINNKTLEKSQKNEDVLVTLILDKGGVNDGSFNESAWSGAEQASKELGIEVKYLESNTDADYVQNIETAIDLESDLIIGVGFNLSKVIEDAAKSYPNQQFAIVDGSFEEIPSNVTPIVFDEKEAGYLAGIVAAKTIQSDSNKIGFIGGFEVPAVINYRDGFEKGLLEVNPNATLLTQYANSFTDAAKGRVIAEQMSNEGVECIMTAAGGVNNGVYETCKEKSKYAVAVDMAQSYISPNTILTSAIKKVDVGVTETIKSYVDGNLKGGVNITYSMKNDGVDYEKTELLSDETINYVESIKEALSK